MFYVKTSPRRSVSLFDELFNYDFHTEAMKTDIKENDKEYVLITDLPGVDKSNINITFEDSTLRIEVNQSVDKEINEDGYIMKERSIRNMSRDFYLENGDDSSIKAKLKDGVLTISVMKLTEKPSKRKCISIN